MTPSNMISVIVAILFVVFIMLGDSSQIYFDELHFSAVITIIICPEVAEKVTEVTSMDHALRTELRLQAH